ncbi:abortive infection family protein [Runella salmonicolor]|nr:abortive infection family protein [Runella salmonicolor]
MKLIKEINEAIWREFNSYEQVRYYISKWHEDNYDQNGFNDYYWENFKIVENESKKINLLATLNSMDGTTLLKVAIDLGVDTPDFIPSIPTFKNEVKSEYITAYDTFQKAYKQIESDPSLAIGLANSALESIIKEILKDNRISSKISGRETLYKLTLIIVKEFNLTDPQQPNEIKTIGSSLIAIGQAIEILRSDKTNFHGKTTGDYLITDTIFAYFLINSVATVGLFINSYYKTKYPKRQDQQVQSEESEDNLPF